MPRRAKRRSTSAATNRQIAQRELQEFAQQLRRPIARGVQEAAIATMNGLVKVGPAWSGEFSASWRFVPEGGNPGGPGSDGKIYKYTKNDVRIDTIEKYMKGGTGPSTKVSSNVAKFQIVNTALHANLAIDSEAGYFRRDLAEQRGWPEPLKDPTLGDERNNPSFRYDIGGGFSGSFKDAPASRTAEPDWYHTYVEGGGLQRDLGEGMSLGFKTSF